MKTTTETREEREERIYREQVARGRRNAIREGGGNGSSSGENRCAVCSAPTIAGSLCSHCAMEV